jgi:RpiB/LacA/LacB family sugar-phosphate isomerase
MVSGKKVSLGIAICKTGIGMSIIANKLPGVRAALCHTVQDAVSSREHNDANVLVIGASRHTSKEALKMTLAWVEAKHLGGRHARRVRQMKELEKKVFKRTN